jgi:hypothetical protein
MTVKVNLREKRLIIAGIVTAAAVGIFYAGTMLLPDSQNLSRNVEIKERMLLSQREILSREDLYRTRLEQYRKQLDLDLQRFLPGDSPSLAGTELQKVVKAFADQNGVEITQRTILPDKKVQDTIAKVSIRIETNCAPEQLVQLMAAIENYEKLLKIDEVQITAFKLAKKYEIRPSMTISGFISVPEDKTKPQI